MSQRVREYKYRAPDTYGKQMEKRLIGIKEASEYLGIPKGSLYKLVWQRRVPFVVRVGRSLRFDKIKMNLWIEENTIKQEDFETIKRW